MQQMTGILIEFALGVTQVMYKKRVSTYGKMTGFLVALVWTFQFGITVSLQA
jgi:hypothetical protein